MYNFVESVVKMGNITKSALFDYENLNEEKISRNEDPYHIYTDKVAYGVYDGKTDELICKTELRRDAKLTIKEFKEIDKENGEHNSYYIKKL